ncbi:MAG: hypothetical protein RLZZ292_1831 [Bacteroidota bacterium]|jgi:predicted ATPase
MHTHLTRVHLKGYRNIQDTETTFREGLNIIIGPNGCGKTNFLWLLANIDEKETNKRSISAEIEESVRESIVIKSKIWHELEQNKIVKKSLMEDGGTLMKNVSPLNVRLLLPFNLPTKIECFSTGNTIPLEFKGNSLYLSTSNDVLQLTFYVKKLQNYPKVELSDLNFEQYTIDFLKKYTPIQDIRVEFPKSQEELKPISEYEVLISNLIYSFKTNNEWFKWDELSDGTRRIVWLILNILTTHSNVILIEEPELGIHPHQLKLLMRFIKEQSAHKQIIMTTHAPEVLDILDEDELDRIKIARYDEERKTTVIEGIPAKRQAIIQKYLQKTGLLSGFWSRIDLEGTRGFPKT